MLPPVFDVTPFYGMLENRIKVQEPVPVDAYCFSIESVLTKKKEMQ